MHVDERMMQEVAEIKKAVDPTEILFVVDSMTGQDAVNTAQEFNERLDFDGVVLTKLDGDTRGGAALSIRSVVEKPIKFASMGEKLDALTPFYPRAHGAAHPRDGRRRLVRGEGPGAVRREAGREAAQEDPVAGFRPGGLLRTIAEDQEDGLASRSSGYDPGVGKQIRDLDVDDDAFQAHRGHDHVDDGGRAPQPDLINGSRRRRIATGAGVEVRDVNQLLKQFREMKKMMKTMSKLMGKGRTPDLQSLMAWRQ
jgi:signal recognition particle subunit SRP54